MDKKRELLIFALTMLSGCATLHYASNRPAIDVAECIVAGWKKAPRSGYELPVSLEKKDESYFVGVELRNCFSPLPTGTKHGTYPVWAEVNETKEGSTTEYHRAYQIMHAAIDRIVKECQSASSTKK
jgi:hypothetical protein